MTRRVKTAIVGLLVVVVGCLVYAYQFRYYLRIIPLPIDEIGLLYGGPDAPAPRMTVKGNLAFPPDDLRDPQGLRRALNFVRGMSPLRRDAPPMDYRNITFAGWLAQLSKRSMLCTDATALFMLMAHHQGIPVREWWLWTSDGWANGQAHSVPEFYNSRSGRWQVVDPLTATIIRREDGVPASMADVLRDRKLIFDRSHAFDFSSRPDLNSASLFSIRRTPVLNLKPPQFLATTPRSDLVIGYAILTGDSRHNNDIYWTKVAVAVALAGLLVIAFLLYKNRGNLWRRRSSRNSASFKAD